MTPMECLIKQLLGEPLPPPKVVIRYHADSQASILEKCEKRRLTIMSMLNANGEMTTAQIGDAFAKNSEADREQILRDLKVLVGRGLVRRAGFVEVKKGTKVILWQAT